MNQSDCDSKLLSKFEELTKEIFTVQHDDEFNQLCIRIFLLQYKTNTIYQRYVDLIHVDPEKISSVAKIPFLPIEFFKHYKVISGSFEPKLVFSSSGTTGMQRSHHFIVSPQLYIESFTRAFTRFIGNPARFCILGLLPGYLERKDSSLIYMVNHLMQISGNPQNGFYLNDLEKLKDTLFALKKAKQKYVLLGVTYSLLDFANKYPMDLSDGIVIETGGMKGKRKEMLKAEMYQILNKQLNISNIYSEYGMTELLSQAYSTGDGKFETPPWMRVLIRDPYDPFNYIENGRGGGINIIDLANLYSCSFIETKDLGKLNPFGQFEVLGRLENTDIRGCNLLVS